MRTTEKGDGVQMQMRQEAECPQCEYAPCTCDVDDDDFDDGVPSDCGMGEDGQCQYAGTEECDECPMWDED